MEGGCFVSQKGCCTGDLFIFFLLLLIFPPGARLGGAGVLIQREVRMQDWMTLDRSVSRIDLDGDGDGGAVVDVEE